jgi:hypothetical protein
MHDNFGSKDEEYIFEQVEGKSEACPVMSVLHNLQAVPIEVNITSKVHGVESFQRDLVRASVLKLIGLMFESKVMLDGATWVFGLFVFAGREGGCDVPEGDQDGD